MGAVCAGERLARIPERIASEQGLGAQGDETTPTPMRVTNSTGARKEAVILTKRDVAVITRRGNISQFQSRSLYGALGLGDDQWRQVDRVLAAYYQEGFARHLDGRNRPAAGVEAWQQQRAELSRRAFAAVNTHLAPEQASQFQKLYQGENWLWAVESSL